MTFDPTTIITRYIYFFFAFSRKIERMYVRMGFRTNTFASFQKESHVHTRCLPLPDIPRNDENHWRSFVPIHIYSSWKFDKYLFLSWLRVFYYIDGPMHDESIRKWISVDGLLIGKALIYLQKSIYIRTHNIYIYIITSERIRDISSLHESYFFFFLFYCFYFFFSFFFFFSQSIRKSRSVLCDRYNDEINELSVWLRLSVSMISMYRMIKSPNKMVPSKSTREIIYLSRILKRLPLSIV